MLQFEKLVYKKFTNELLKFDNNTKNWEISISPNFRLFRLENFIAEIYYLQVGILKFVWAGVNSKSVFFNLNIPAARDKETIKKVFQTSLNIAEEENNLTLAFNNIVVEALKAYKKYKINLDKKEKVIKNKLKELDAKIMEEYGYSHICSYYDQNNGIKITSTDRGFYDTNFLTFQLKRDEVKIVMHTKEMIVKEFNEIVYGYYKLVSQILYDPDRIKRIIQPYLEFIDREIEEEEENDDQKGNS